MVCKKCKKENDEQAKFCANCGSPLKENDKFNLLDYLKTMAESIIKPSKFFKDKTIDLKKSFIYALILSVIATIITIIEAMYDAVVVKSVSWFNEVKTEIHLNNLLDEKFIVLGIKAFVIFLGIILLLALIYYLASLVIKKEIPYPKMIAYATCSIAPIYLAILVLKPILGIISPILGTFIVIVALIYTVIILIENINVGLKEDKKIYFHLACLSIFTIIMYYGYFHILIDNLKF